MSGECATDDVTPQHAGDVRANVDQCATVVVHGEAMIAEGVAAALRSYPAIRVIDVATTLAAVRVWEHRAEAVALDHYLCGAQEGARRLRSNGVHVVLLGERDGDCDDPIVSTKAPISALVEALLPHSNRRRGYPQLTRREGEVLALVAGGLTGIEVARRLNISPKTVEQRKTRAFSKLGVTNQTAAVRKALMSGLIPWVRNYPTA